MPAPRQYPLELCELAVRTYRTAEAKPVIRRMAEELGVHHEALRGWIRQAQADAGERDGLLTTEKKEELPPPLCFPRSCKRTAGLRARHDCSPLSNG